MIAEFELPLREYPGMRLISIRVPLISVARGMQMLRRLTYTIHPLQTQWAKRGAISTSASIGNAHRRIQTTDTRIFNTQSTFLSYCAILRPMGADVESPQTNKNPPKPRRALPKYHAGRREGQAKIAFILAEGRMTAATFSGSAW